jgi:hypothetical protein
MSIVTRALNQLELISAAFLRNISFWSTLHETRSFILPVRLNLTRQWFYASSANEFERKQLAQRAFNESMGRSVIVR